MRKISFLLLILCTVGFIIHGCREDSNPSNVFQNEQGIQKLISYEQLVSKIGKLDPDVLKIKSSKSKNIYEQFQIDESKIIEIQNSNGDASYSMRINPTEPSQENNNGFYNLYLQKTNDTFTHTIVKYIPSLEYSLGLTSDFSGSYEVLHSTQENVAGKSGSCYELVVVVPCDAGNIHPEDGPEHCNGYGGSWHFYFEVCGGGGSSSGGDSGSGSGIIGGGPTNGGTSGGGGSGNPPGNGNGSGNPGVLITPDGDPIDNPCVKASTATVASSTLLKSNQVQTNVDAVLKTKIQAPNEFGLKIGKNFETGNHSFSNIVEGNSTSADLSNAILPWGTYIADAHSHAGGRGHASAGDLYDMLAKVSTDTHFTTRFIYGNDYGNPEIYALTFTDKALASSFLAQYPKAQNFDQQSNSFSLNTQLGIEYNDALEFASQGTFENTNNQGENYS